MDARLWRGEVEEFRDDMEKLAGMKISAENLRAGIKLMNRKRRALQRISEFRKLDEPPISGLDALLVSQAALNQDVEKFCRGTEALAEELADRAEKGASAYEKPGIRVLIAGSPSPMGNAKVHYIVESSGMRIVADESCTGMRYFRDLVDETPRNTDGMIDAVADRYFKIDCACFSPNKERIENILNIIKDYKIGGVVHNILQYCHGYDIEAKAVDMALAKNGIPSIKIVTDYSEEDIEQIRVRLETFAEVSHEGRAAAKSG